MSAPRGPFRLPPSDRRAASDVEREIAFHLSLREADLVAAGMSAEEARTEARRQFGDPTEIGAECLAVEGDRQERVRRRDRLATFVQDLSLAFRALRRAPGFTMAAVLTLGIGLGATTALFGIVDAVLLRPLPVVAPERVVVLVPRVGAEQRGGSPGFLTAWSEQARTLRYVAGGMARSATLLEHGEAERLSGGAVTGTWTAALGVSPLLGRSLVAADDVPGAPPVVVLGERVWQRTFARDARVLGRTIVLDGRARTVVGVLPATLDAVGGVAGGGDFWVPLALPASQRDNFTPYLTIVARLTAGATPATATRELGTIAAGLGPRATDDGVLPTIDAVPLDRYLLADYRRPLLLMLAAVAAVLLIGCANVSTLVLARNVSRVREMAVRASLGAGRARLVWQLAAEHVVLGVLAALVALPVAAIGTRVLAVSIPAEVPRLADAGLDARALAVAVTLGIVTSLLCGVLPALQHGRLDVRSVLQGGTRGATDRRGDWWRRGLVGAEVALAFVLVAGAGLLIRSAVSLARVRPGFDTENVLTARLALPQRDYPELPATVRTYERVVDAVRQQPGVRAAAVVSRIPLGGSLTSVDVALAERPLVAGVKVNASLRIASPQYFRAIGIPMLAGRDLTDADDARATAVVVVNASLARRLLGGDVASIVGRRIHTNNGAFADSAGAPKLLEIVGVVGDVRDGGPRAEPQPEFYAPMGQVSEEPWNYWIEREMVLVARVPGDVGGAAPALRRAVASVDPRLPLYDVQTTGERVGRALAVERFDTRLLTLLGALGLGLAALGIHGVVAYTVGRRTREVGVRLALGATTPQAVALVVRQSMRPIVIGLAVGSIAALIAGRAAAGLLYGVSPADPITLLGAAVVLASVGLAACWLPARRIARVDPSSSLRAE